EGARFLSADQFLLTTLIVKLAVMAVLATMLARYHRFRHILIFERRGWLDRLAFTLALGIPLMAGVAARLLLAYKAADLSLEGAFLGAPIALELLRQALGARFGVARLFYPGADLVYPGANLGTPPPLMMLLIILATVLAVATPIKIWNSARIEHRLQEQEKLLLAAKIE